MKNDDEDDEEFGFQYMYVARTVQKSEVIIFENSCRPSLSSVRRQFFTHVA